MNSKNYHLDMKIKALYESGKTADEVAKELDISSGSVVISHLKQMNIQRRKSARREGLKMPRKFGIKLSLSKIGDKNPNWKGDNITVGGARERAKKLFPTPKGYERHHKDGNPLNNHPSNIEILTRKQHMVSDGRLDGAIARLPRMRKKFANMSRGKTLEELYGKKRAEKIRTKTKNGMIKNNVSAKISAKLKGNKNAYKGSV